MQLGEPVQLGPTRMCDVHEDTGPTCMCDDGEDTGPTHMCDAGEDTGQLHSHTVLVMSREAMFSLQASRFSPPSPPLPFCLLPSPSLPSCLLPSLSLPPLRSLLLADRGRNK